jgi:hypothetical protein
MRKIVVHNTYRVFKYTLGTSGEMIITRNVRWEHWEPPFKSLSNPTFTKVQGLSKDQQDLVGEAIDQFMFDNKMCPAGWNCKDWTNDKD